jgi:multimeric flavodoxin WrbA
MKATIINGYNENNLFNKKITQTICNRLDGKGITYHLNDLTKINPRNCTGCDCCQNIKPGICVIDDGINEVLEQYLHSDIAIIVTPVQFGSCNSITKNFLDRTQPLFLPYQGFKKGKTIMKNRYDKYPDIVFIGIIADNDIDSIETFKDSLINSNLSIASNKVRIQIINENADNDFNLEALNLI